MRKLVFILLSLFSTVYAQKRPNIVIIISDDHAYQTIGAYGASHGETPHIDRIAKEGAVFKNAFVTNSICGPSRAVLLTGKYSHKNGFKDNATSTFDFTQDSFIKRLTSTGYKTSWIGKIHLGTDLQGFSDYDVLIGQGHYFNPDFVSPEGKTQVKGYVSDIVTEKSINWIDQHKDSAFCIVIGHKATHRTWMPDPKDFGAFDQVDYQLPNTYYDDYASREAAAQQEMEIGRHMRMGYDLKMFETIEEMRQDPNFSRMDEQQFQQYVDYYRPIYEDLKTKNLSGNKLSEWKFRRYMIDYMNTAKSMDRGIGRVLDYLKESNLEENTLVIYLSDQGFYMGEHGWFDKRWMYEESFRTPLIAMLPSVIESGTTINAKISNVDIAPTLLDLAGVEVPSDMQGKSFLSTLKGSKKEVNKVLYYHYYEKGEHAVSPHFGVRNDRYKLIRYYGLKDGWEFFDLRKDPNELNNIYEESSYSKQIRNLKIELRKEIIRLDDTEALKLID